MKAAAAPPRTVAWGTVDDGKELTMLYYALVFLVVGLIAGALGLFGVAAVATQIA